MRFMHISDVHLGVKPDQGRAWSERRTQDIWDSFAEVIAVAARKKIEYLFITGDLFHAQPLKRELKEVGRLFEQIPQTKIFLIAGNHDYLQPKSYYLSYPWPDNVYFFQKEEVEAIDFPKDNITVYGMSYWHREIRERLYDEVRPTNGKRINLFLAHGGDEKHIPCNPATFVNNGFDYTMMGHIHKGGQLIPGKVTMAGALEPTDCNDFGPHGYWVGELEKGHCELHFFPIRKCQYCVETFPVEPKTTGREVLEWARNLIQESEPYQLFRIQLKGYADPDMEFGLERIEALEQVLDVTCDILPNYDYEKLKEEHQNTLVEAYITSMQEMEQTNITKKALEYGVSALLGHQICR